MVCRAAPLWENAMATVTADITIVATAAATVTKDNRTVAIATAKGKAVVLTVPSIGFSEITVPLGCTRVLVLLMQFIISPVLTYLKVMHVSYKFQ